MTAQALHTLLLIPGWLGLVGLVGLGLLWPWRHQLPQRDALGLLAVAWWLGYAGLGWATMLVGYAGGLKPWGLIGLGAPAALGAAWLWQQRFRLAHAWQGGGHRWALLGLVMAAGLNLPTALTPPTEADTLAYHFALPALYAQAGALVFEPVAVTFATPQLTHMVSTFALVLGGEPLLLAQAWGSSLMAAVAVFALARQWLPVGMALAVALVFIGTPLMTYAFSNGTVELRQAGLLAAAGMAWVWSRQRVAAWPLGVLAVLVGAVAASKLFGLFILPPLALLWLAQLPDLGWRRWGGQTALLAGLGLLVAAPWYISAWVQYGSPVFPVLSEALGSPFWSAAQQAYMERAYLANELMVPRTFGTWLSYPLTATFAGAALDSDRTGLGPFLPLGMLAAVLLLAQAWRQRQCPPLAVLAGLALGFYTLWFFFGVSGRSRHLLPVLPYLLVALGAVLWAWWPAFGRLVRVGLGALLVLVLLAQSGMALLLNRTAFMALVQQQPREAYLASQVTHYAAASLANLQLTSADKLLVVDLRPMLYYLRVPYFHNADFETQKIPVAIGTVDEVWQALQAHGFTSWLTWDGAPTNALLHALAIRGCATIQGQARGYALPSRTLGRQQGLARFYTLYRLTPAACLGAAGVVQPPG